MQQHDSNGEAGDTVSVPPTPLQLLRLPTYLPCRIHQSPLRRRQRPNNRSVGETAKGAKEVAPGLMACH